MVPAMREDLRANYVIRRLHLRSILMSRLFGSYPGRSRVTGYLYDLRLAISGRCTHRARPCVGLGSSALINALLIGEASAGNEEEWKAWKTIKPVFHLSQDRAQPAFTQIQSHFPRKGLVNPVSGLKCKHCPAPLTSFHIGFKHKLRALHTIMPLSRLDIPHRPRRVASVRARRDC